MSRTDKDDPDFVRARRSTQARTIHGRNCVHAPHPDPDRVHPCDADTTRTYATGACHTFANDRDRWYDTVTPAMTHMHWYRPERAHVRVSLLNAARDWNMHGDTDVEPNPRQHRRGPWTGGFWD